MPKFDSLCTWFPRLLGGLIPRKGKINPRISARKKIGKRRLVAVFASVKQTK